MTIIDLALDTNDKEWFNSLVNTVEKDIIKEKPKSRDGYYTRINKDSIYGDSMNFKNKSKMETIDSKNNSRGKRSESIGFVCVSCGEFKMLGLSDWITVCDELIVCRECFERISRYQL